MMIDYATEDRQRFIAGSETQAEIRVYADAVAQMLRRLFPRTMELFDASQ